MIIFVLRAREYNEIFIIMTEVNKSISGIKMKRK